MKAIITLCTILIVATGCSPESNENISDKENIVIVQNIPAGVCESSEYSIALEAIGFNDYITQETNKDVTCEDYGKSTKEKNCAIIPYYTTLTDTVNCVIGYNPAHENITEIPNGK